jgi:hypothetical protein
VSLRVDGTYHCDRCDVSVGNGGVDLAASVSDVRQVEQGGLTLPVPVTFHFCRDRVGEDGKVVRGCVNRVLTAKALAAWPGRDES